MSEGTVSYAQEQNTWFITLVGDVRHILAPGLNALLDRALAESDEVRFVVDLSQVQTIDSTCLGTLALIVNRQKGTKAPRPVIITGSEDVSELLLAVCFDRMFDLVESTDIKPQGQLHTLPMFTVDEYAMLTLVLDAHRRLCDIDEKTHAVFHNVVELLEADATKLAHKSIME